MGSGVGVSDGLGTVEVGEGVAGSGVVGAGVVGAGSVGIVGTGCIATGFSTGFSVVVVGAVVDVAFEPSSPATLGKPLP